MKWIVGAALAAGMMTTAQASAATDPYQVVVTGVVGSAAGGKVSTLDTQGLFGTLAAGDAFTATYRYDRDKLANMTSSSQIGGLGNFWFPFSTASITINGQTLELPDTAYAFIKQSATVNFQGIASQGLELDYKHYRYPEYAYMLNMNLTTLGQEFFSDQNVLANSLLANGPVTFDLTDYSDRHFQSGSISASSYAGDNFLRVSLLPRSLQISAVPEPATWALMLTGMMMAGYALRRRNAAVKLV